MGFGDLSYAASRAGLGTSTQDAPSAQPVFDATTVARDTYLTPGEKYDLTKEQKDEVSKRRRADIKAAKDAGISLKDYYAAAATESPDPPSNGSDTHTPVADAALQDEIYDYLLNNMEAGSGYLLPNGVSVEALKGLSLTGGTSAFVDAYQDEQAWLKDNPGKKSKDYQAYQAAKVLDPLYEEYGNGMSRADFDATYAAAKKEFGEYWDSLPRYGIAQSADGLGGTPTQLAPTGYENGKLIYSMPSTSVFTGSADRVSYVYQGWKDEDWVKEQAAAGKLGIHTYTDADGKEQQALWIDPSIVNDERFGVKKVGGYRGANDSDTGMWGSLGIDAGVGQLIGFGAILLTAGASLGAGALATEGATIGTAAGFEAGSAAAGAVTGAAMGGMTSAALGADPLEGALVGAATGGLTGAGGVVGDTLLDVKNTLGAYLDTGPIGQAAVDAAVNGAVTGAVGGAVFGNGFGDILTGAVAGGASAGVGTYVGGTVYEWARGTGFENTLAGGAGGAAAGATAALVTGNDISDGALIGGASGLVSGGLIDFGAGSAVSGAGSSIAKTLVGQELQDDDQTTTTTTGTNPNTNTNTETETQQPYSLGIGFGDALDVNYAPVSRRNMQWGTRLSSMKGT